MPEVSDVLDPALSYSRFGGGSAEERRPARQPRGPNVVQNIEQRTTRVIASSTSSMIVTWT
jgi:hypothetical protein